MRFLMGLSLLALALAGAGCTRNNEGFVSAGLRSSSPPSLAKPPGTSTATPDHLRVTVMEISVHVTAVEPETKVESDEEGAWVTVFGGRERLDLRDAAVTEAFLGEAVVPAGRITQIRLILADDAELVVDGKSTPISCGSCTQTGLKIVTHGDLVVGAGERLHVVLDFDQQLSLVSDGIGGLRLRPVVRIFDAKKNV